MRAVLNNNAFSILLATYNAWSPSVLPVASPPTRMSYKPPKVRKHSCTPCPSRLKMSNMSYSALQRVVANPRALKAYLDDQEPTATETTQQRSGNNHNRTAAATSSGAGEGGVAFATHDSSAIHKMQSTNVKVVSGVQRSLDRLVEGSAGYAPEHSSKEAPPRNKNVVLGMDHEATEVSAMGPRVRYAIGFNIIMCSI